MPAPAAHPGSESPIHGCRFCWMCRHVCPVGHVTALETFTPHAWALLIDAVDRGVAQWNAETVGVLYACAECGMCRTHCKTDQPLPDAIAAARAGIVRAGAAPSTVGALDARLRQWANLYEEAAPTPGASGPTALFAGDAAVYRQPGTVDAARALLAAAGATAAPIGVGRSTGLVASALGLHETAATLARAIVDEVRGSGCREVLVLGPGDRYAFTRVYRERLGVDWPAEVPVREVTDVLADAVAAGRLGFKQAAEAVPYTYYDPCHAPRIGRDGRAPRALLAAALGTASARDMFWRQDRSHPCGAVGGLEFTRPDIAGRLADARLADAAQAGARRLITEDPSCLHQLQGRKGAGIEVAGLFEVVRERIA
jgi:Fe-S oxidoreductase